MELSAILNLVLFVGYIALGSGGAILAGLNWRNLKGVREVSTIFVTAVAFACAVGGFAAMTMTLMLWNPWFFAVDPELATRTDAVTAFIELFEHSPVLFGITVVIGVLATFLIAREAASDPKGLLH